MAQSPENRGSLLDLNMISLGSFIGSRIYITSQCGCNHNVLINFTSHSMIERQNSGGFEIYQPLIQKIKIDYGM